MAVYDLEEQEQLDELKAWWAQWGNLITGVIVAIAVASVGWQGWKWYQRKESAQAAALYAMVEKAAAQQDPAAARQATGQILEKYSGTAYATLAAMLSAKLQADAGDTENAVLPLQWVIDHADLAIMRDIARLRLAAVRLNGGDAQGALAVLDKAPSETLLVRYYDLRGDALTAAGKIDEAKAAYDKALAQVNANPVAGDRSAEIIRLKRDALSGGAQ
ncbi:tetratricopeptide repeat protein [Nitrogeniibacter mangrovi]|uniref:Ancillary SecYEG translocon subunit n=1 Tax=Nitrogeniibacter mangrovi TaxID=2016596 RepID=A0A6C1B4F9_9RHOO|nr:tetratricopeptide repeat protein [Nitrogeniibacter mangrovi]QID18581.1 tetratricopeptide repeat protein [Nitrogeniibacter mangrovi]